MNDADGVGPARRGGARLRAALLAAFVVALAVGACGDSGGDAGSVTTDLTFELDTDGNDGAAIPLNASVECPPAGESGEQACDLVAELPGDPAAETPPDTACTEIYGGSEVLTVKGTLNGAQIDASFTRANGCEIERYDRWAPLLATIYPDYTPGQGLAPPPAA